MLASLCTRRRVHSFMLETHDQSEGIADQHDWCDLSCLALEVGKCHYGREQTLVAYPRMTVRRQPCNIQAVRLGASTDLSVASYWVQ